jgi:hypothetical protein
VPRPRGDPQEQHGANQLRLTKQSVGLPLPVDLKGQPQKGEHLKLRNIAIGTIVPMAAAASFAIPTHAAKLVPSITKVSTKMVLNSHITLGGGFVLQLLAGPGSLNVASFDLYRYTDLAGGWQYLGHYGGNNTTDEMQQNFGLTEYGMVPYDNNGNSGNEAYSNEFYPYAFDSTSTAWSVASGSWATVNNSKFYGGSAIETFSAGAAVDFNNECAYNDSIVIATGPSGGIANAYVNGAKQPGTVNFWSKKAGYLKVAFKYGTSGTNCSTFQFVETKHGKGGGNDMWFDADVQIYL